MEHSSFSYYIFFFYSKTGTIILPRSFIRRALKFSLSLGPRFFHFISLRLRYLFLCVYIQLLLFSSYRKLLFPFREYDFNSFRVLRVNEFVWAFIILCLLFCRLAQRRLSRRTKTVKSTERSRLTRPA